MSSAPNQSLVPTMLLLEAGLAAIDERLQISGTDEFADTVESLGEIYLRLGNLMRELAAALEYSLKVNREVAALHNESRAQLLRMFDALETAEGTNP